MAEDAYLSVAVLAFYTQMKGVFGKPSETITFLAGKQFGSYFEGNDAEKALIFLNSLGLGEMSFDKISNRYARITVKDPKEALESGRKSSFFTRGVLSGVVEKLMDRPVNLLEISCFAENGKPCVFETEAEFFGMLRSNISFS